MGKPRILSKREIGQQVKTSAALDAVTALADMAEICAKLSECHDYLNDVAFEHEMNLPGADDMAFDVAMTLAYTMPGLVAYLARQAATKMHTLNHELWHTAEAEDDGTENDLPEAEPEAA